MLNRLHIIIVFKQPTLLKLLTSCYSHFQLFMSSGAYVVNILIVNTYLKQLHLISYLTRSFALVTFTYIYILSFLYSFTNLVFGVVLFVRSTIYLYINTTDARSIYHVKCGFSAHHSKAESKAQKLD